MTVAQARKTLDEAKRMINAAENAAMATDGPVPATREIMTNEEFDKFARLVLKAREQLDPAAGRVAIKQRISRDIANNRR